MLLHPAFIIACFIPALLATARRRKLFKCISMIFPLITGFFLFLETGEHSWILYNIKLTWEVDYTGRLISLAFLAVLLAANSYATSQGRFSEVIIGSAYCASALLSILAKDFISIFIGVELMMIMSSLIIFIGRQHGSPTAAKRYFLTHLVSGNLVLFGIAHVISINNSTEIIPLANLFSNPAYSRFILYAMFTGMIINIAAFPFSGWMVNYYKEASGSGFLYLISFTSKVSIILLIKLFAGFEPLKYIGLLMILYAGFKAIFEDNIFGLLCYLSIISMGVMAIGISSGSEAAILGVSIYLFVHIIYKSLLTMVAAILRDKCRINLCSELSSIKDKTLVIATAIGIALMSNLPFTPSFYGKLAICNPFSNSLFYIALLLANLLVILPLPWREYFQPGKIIKTKINFYNRFSLVILLLLACWSCLPGWLSPFAFLSPMAYDISASGTDIIKQLSVFVASAIICISLHQPRKEGEAINVIEKIGLLSSWLYKRTRKTRTQKQIQEARRFDILEEQVMRRLAAFHNQQTAISSVFVLLIVMLTILFIPFIFN